MDGCAPAPPPAAGRAVGRAAGQVLQWAGRKAAGQLGRHWLNGYLAQWVPSLFPASSSRKFLDYAVLECMFSWRARYPLS